MATDAIKLFLSNLKPIHLVIGLICLLGFGYLVTVWTGGFDNPQTELINNLKTQRDEALKNADKFALEAVKQQSLADSFRAEAIQLRQMREEQLKEYEELKKNAEQIERDIQEVMRGFSSAQR